MPLPLPLWSQLLTLTQPSQIPSAAQSQDLPLLCPSVLRQVLRLVPPYPPEITDRLTFDLESSQKRRKQGPQFINEEGQSGEGRDLQKTTQQGVCHPAGHSRSAAGLTRNQGLLLPMQRSAHYATLLPTLSAPSFHPPKAAGPCRAGRYCGSPGACASVPCCPQPRLKWPRPCPGCRRGEVTVPVGTAVDGRKG